MLVLVAILFCTLSLSFAFKFIVPYILKNVSKHTGRRIELNPLIVISVFIINSIISLWIYAQLVLIFSGESEQVGYNIYFIVQNFYPPNILKSIELSLKYDANSFISQIIFQSILYLIVYLKVIIKIKNRILTSLFFITLLLTYVNIPLDIVEVHNESVRLAKAEQERIAAEAVLNRNTEIYLELKKDAGYLRRYAGCLNSYKWGGSITYLSSLNECKKAEDFCLFVERMYAVKEDYKEDLRGSKNRCYSEGWYSIRKYSKDFDLEE
ncbi:MAG: hypothetical protein WBA41_13730 [Rivularia sp. (in: cyanobacteria)]